MPTIKVLVGRNTHGQSLPLQSETKLFRLFLPRLGDGRFPNPVRLHTNFKGRLTVQGANHFAERPDDVIEGVDFVVVQ